MDLGPILVADKSDVGKIVCYIFIPALCQVQMENAPLLGNSVAAGTGNLVSNKEYPDNVLLVGVPARILRQRE